MRQRAKRPRGEKPWVKTPVVLPRPGVPLGDTTGRSKRLRTGVLRRGHCRPKCPTRLPTGWHSYAVFRAQLERIFALFRQLDKTDPRRDTTGSDSRRAPEAWCSSTGTLQAQIPTWLLTLLSNTPHDILAAPILLSTVVPFVVCRGRRAIFLRCAVHDGLKDQVFPRSGSLCRLLQAHANASVEACATLTPALATGRSTTPCFLAPTQNSRRIQP